jgi:hypothetical protein
MEIVSAGREYYIESWELVGRGTNTYGGLFFLYILVFPQQLYVPTWTYVYTSKSARALHGKKNNNILDEKLM